MLCHPSGGRAYSASFTYSPGIILDLLFELRVLPSVLPVSVPCNLAMSYFRVPIFASFAGQMIQRLPLSTDLSQEIVQWKMVCLCGLSNSLVGVVGCVVPAPGTTSNPRSVSNVHSIDPDDRIPSHLRGQGGLDLLHLREALKGRPKPDSPTPRTRSPSSQDQDSSQDEDETAKAPLMQQASFTNACYSAPKVQF